MSTDALPRAAPAPAAPGVCAIKPQYVQARAESCPAPSPCTEDAPDAKKPKVEEANNKKNKQRGQNKARPVTYRPPQKTSACPTIVDVTATDTRRTCTYKNCKFVHDPIEYLKLKPADIRPECHNFTLKGRCPRGVTCRFGSKHVSPEGFNIVDQERANLWKEDVLNGDTHGVQMQLQRRNYDLTKSERVKKEIDTFMQERKNAQANSLHSENMETDEKEAQLNVEVKDEDKNGLEEKSLGFITDEDLIKILPREKKAINWNDKLYLSPLTTVGNLPFRRICKEYGVDITCGEMALCESLLKGVKPEWALLKRHSSEDLFGVQICGNNSSLISKVAQVIEEQITVDFVDLNLGCPIDLVYKRGGGCGMMHRLPALEGAIKCATNLLSVPFTIKMRTGVYQDKKIAHKLVPKCAAWGASLITLHGRSREARYTRSSDWDYIEQCAQAAAPCPVYGNGDIFSYEDYVQRRGLAPTVKGVMVGRGALIKPWIFTEIKEQRIWDIRSSERFDMIKKYTNYGLEHWGSDTKGVENTRRFLLEWLSFLYRYVPVGLLERPPQKINERPPIYFGRDDLETLMASGNCVDWIKISEMVLGPVPDGFNFLPKHKANSYK